MAPSTACVAPPISRTPPVQQQLQQRQVQQCQPPVSQPHQGQQPSQQHYLQHQNQQRQEHVVQQRLAQQQQQILHRQHPQPQRYSQQQHLDRLHMLRQQQVQRQPGQGPDDQEGFSRLSLPCPLSLPPDQSSLMAVTAALAHLSHNVPWCSGHTNQDGRDCLANSAVLTAMQQQVNSTPPSDKRPIPAGFPPLSLTRSEVGFLPAAARTGTLAAVLSARNKSGSNPFPSSVCTLASSGSGLSDTSTSPGDGSTVVSASAACLDSSQNLTPPYAGQSSAATPDAVESPTSSPLRRTATSGVVPPHHPVRTPRQQMRNQPQQKQQLPCQPLPQLSQRQPIGSSVQQQQQRPPRQQHGIVFVDSESALAARHLRCTAATTPTAAAARFKCGYGSRNSMGPQQVSTGPVGNRRVKHQARQQHDQRTEIERQRQTQLPQQQTHYRCTSAGVQQHQQPADISEGTLGTSISCYPTVHVVPTGEAGAVSFSSGVLPRAACEDLSLSLDDWNTSRRANADSAVSHHVHGHHTSGSSRSSSSLAYMTAVGCEAFANASGGTRGLGLPPLPYLYYDLRIRGGAGWPSASITDSSQTPRNNGNTKLRLAGVASSQSLEDRATRGKDSLPSSGEAANAARAPPPTYDMAATAAVHGYTPSPTHVAKASNNACLTLKKPSFDRTESLAAQKAAKDATAATAGAPATAMAASINCRTAVHRLQRRLAQHASRQSRSGEFQPQNLHLTPGTAKLQKVANSGANYRNSATPGKPQLPANRPKVTTAGSEPLREQQPTVTLPLLWEPTVSKRHATPALQTEDYRLPCGGLVAPARPTLLSEEVSLPADNSCFWKGSNTALPRAVADSGEGTACTAAGRLAPPAHGGFTSSSESGCAAGGAGVNTPVVSVCASRGDACACRSTDHIGRGRGPGRPDLAPGSHSPLAPPGAAAPTANDSSPANTGQRTNGLERTWLRLLCESEAVAEGKVRTCRSSGPIPPAVLLRAPEKLEGHVISSSSRDILRPPFYGLLQGEGISAGEKTLGTDDAAITSWAKNRKSAGGSRIDVEQSGTRQRQACASTDTAIKAGGRGNGGAAVAILETLHLEKLLQSAIYGAVYRANLHTVFRTTRASKKPRQGNENGQDADSRSSSNVTSSNLYATEHEKHINGAYIEFPRGESPAMLLAAAAQRTGRDGGGSKGDVEGAEEDFDRHNIHSQQMQKDGFVEESYCENFHDEAIGTIELRSQVVAVKVLSLSLQLRASPSLQEDFLSELKFYPYLKGHKNILVPHRVYVDRAQQLLLLVFPFAEFEDLFEVLKKRKKPFAEAEVQWICKQLLQAVLFLHRRGIAMRDLSLENVLMCRCPETGYAVPKLTDPGQAVIVDQEAAAATRTAAIAERYSAVEGNDEYVGQEVKDDRINDGPRGRLWCDAAYREGTETSARRMQQDNNDYDPPAVLLAPDKVFGKSFRPPEVYQQCSYNPFKVDSFCVGWMTYYLLTKQQLFQRATPSDDNWRLLSTKNASDLLLLLGRKNGAVLSVEGLDFVVRLLEDDPERRMTIYQALAHPFIALSKPCPVLADNLFPDDAVTQEQHKAKQRQFYVQLLQQKQRLLQLYTMRWRDQAGLSLDIVREELQQEEKRVHLNHEPPVSAESAPARCEQIHRGVAVYSGFKRTSPGQALLGKCAQSHQRQTSHQQRRELCRGLCQNHSRKALSRSPGGSAAPDSSRDCNLPDERGEQSISLQPPARECFGDFTANGESYAPAAGAKCAATYEEPPDEQPAPTLLVQHSTLLGESPPTTCTPCRCWSAGVESTLQEVPARCGPPGQNLPACEKQVVNQSPRASWEAEGGCGKQALNGIKQRSGEATTERKERQLQLTMRKKLQCSAIDSDTWDPQRVQTTGSDRVEQSPRAQQFSRYAEESAYASQRQLSQWRLITKPAFQSGLSQSSTSGKGVPGETLGHELDVCQPKPVLFAPATVQVPVVRVAELPSPVEEDGPAQVHGERASADKGSTGVQSVSGKFSAQGLRHRASTQKHSDSGRAGLQLHSVQDDNETTTTCPGGLPDTQDCAVKATSRTDVRTGVPDAFAAVESSLPVMEHNLQPSTGTERSSARSEQRVLPLSLMRNNKVTQTLQNKMARAGCLFSSEPRTKGIAVDCRSKAASEERLGPPVMPSRALTRKGCTNGTSCEVEPGGNSRTDSGQRQRHDGVCIKTVNCSFSKGRRGPSSSSTDTGSTAGENCGGRSDSDYCVGVRSNGSASHCSRSNVSCEGLQSCVVGPPVALLPGTGKTGRNVGMHGAAASAESL